MPTNDPTLIFDGDCSFCTSVANHFHKRSRTPIAFVPWQRANLAEFGLTPAQASAQVYLFRDGELFAGAEAFAEFMRLQGDPFHTMVAWAMRLPVLRHASAWGYRLIAQNRHRLPGGTPACKME